MHHDHRDPARAGLVQADPGLALAPGQGHRTTRRRRQLPRSGPVAGRRRSLGLRTAPARRHGPRRMPSISNHHLLHGAPAAPEWPGDPSTPAAAAPPLRGPHRARHRGRHRLRRRDRRAGRPGGRRRGRRPLPLVARRRRADRRPGAGAGAERRAVAGRHRVVGRRWRRSPSEAFAELGGVDALINNVGDVAREQMSWRDMTEESIDHVLAVDIKGTMACIHEFGVADARPGPRQHRQHRLDRDRARQRAGAAVRRREVRHARPHQVVRARVRADGAGQHVRARVHRDRSDARPARTGRRPRRRDAIA